MAADTSLQRFTRLHSNILDLVIGGERNPEEVSEVLQVVKEHRDFLPRLGLAPQSLPDKLGQHRAWQLLYREVFSIELDFVGFTVPAERSGFNRLIVVAAGMTPNRIFAAMQKIFPKPPWRYTEDLDAALDPERQQRTTDRTYAIWCRDRVEADEELKHRSAEDLDREALRRLTLEERLLYEIKFFRETGEHLDVRNITRCDGSRDRDGSVPSVSFNPATGGVSVDWSRPDDRYDSVRARAAVS